MSIEPAVVRARKVFAANKYFVLATQDSKGPWAAALAHTFVAPNHLYVFSQRTSRHGAALNDGGPVAGVIYNSQCTFDEVESIQFSGRGELAHDRESLRAVHEANRKDGDPPVDEAVIDADLAKEGVALYRILVEHAFVLDQKLFEEAGVDAREEVDVATLFSGA